MPTEEKICVVPTEGNICAVPNERKTCIVLTEGLNCAVQASSGCYEMGPWEEKMHNFRRQGGMDN